MCEVEDKNEEEGHNEQSREPSCVYQTTCLHWNVYCWVVGGESKKAASLDMRVGHHVRGVIDVSYTKGSVHAGGDGEGQSGKKRNSCTKMVVVKMRDWENSEKVN